MRAGPARAVALVAAVASTGVLGLTVVAARTWNATTIGLLVASLWSAAVAVADATLLVPAGAPADPARPGRAPVGVVVRLGHEPVDVVRTTLAMTTAAGPVAVASTTRDELVDELERDGVRLFVAPTMAEAVNRAVHWIPTEGTLIVSGSAFPRGAACEHAARQLGDGVGWVTGVATTFTESGYSPPIRDTLRSRMHCVARRHGMTIWEPDATIVRTSLLRAHPGAADRPDGAWLRSLAAEGWRGITLPDAVTARSAPTEPASFWPAQAGRERGAVAELAGAIAAGTRRSRIAALGALLRELYAYPLVLWLLLVASVGRSGTLPLAIGPTGYLGACGAVALLRWVASRSGYGVGLHPILETRAAADGFLGSLLALSSGLTRRIRHLRIGIADQPLLWIALVLTLLATIPLLDRTGRAEGPAALASGVTLVLLVVVWACAVRAFTTRDWSRSIYRLVIDRPALVDGHPTHVIDASPTGIAVMDASPMLRRDSRVRVIVQLPGIRAMKLRGRVANLRTVAGHTVAGITLQLDGSRRATWARALLGTVGLGPRASSVAPRAISGPRQLPDRPSVTLRHRLLVGVQLAVVGAVTAVVSGVLLLPILGYRPLIVRSGSMAPTVRTGDVVVSDWVRADRVRVGDVVSLTSGSGNQEPVTHRVLGITNDDGTVRVTTKGDANQQTEHWVLDGATPVGRAVARVPGIGTAFIVLGRPTVRTILLAASAALVLLAILGRFRGSRRVERNRGSGRGYARVVSPASGPMTSSPKAASVSGGAKSQNHV